jgi:DNA helicase-2/ATP-dependent DNA helicase PcrA
MDFSARLKALNDAQRQAVDIIDGPLMVIAGPGTGKTELLSMRAANILQKTDTLPENILCLTYTDSGVIAMRRRLASIIGPAAYKVAIHTFHSFSTEVINHNRKFFYNGMAFRPADELNRYEILKAIFKELGADNPLSAQMNGTHTYLHDTLSVISELKSSGMTGAELLGVLNANDQVIEIAEKLLAPVLASGIKKTTADALAPLVSELQKLSRPLHIPAIPSLAEMLSESLVTALNQAHEDGSTKPITAWRNVWLKKNERGDFVLKAHERQIKLRAVSQVYDRFIARMQEAGLFDFDDMILNTVHALEVMPELRFNLQEKYLYIMVDEFQDTNLAQMRILLSLINNEVNEGQPNIMVVGDDDQAIYGFQGATVGNIHSFIETFPAAPRVVLTDNYRSVDDILTYSRKVITLGQERLERLLPDVDKTLVAHRQKTAGSVISDKSVRLIELPSTADERRFVVDSIRERIKAGEPPSSIAILARRHHELVNLLPYFANSGIKVNYERRDNVLDLESIQLVEYIARLLIAILDGQLAKACSMLPELLAHPSFRVEPTVLWQLSVRSQNERKTWLDLMPAFAELALIHSWLIEGAALAAHTPLERMCDYIIGAPHSISSETTFVSPLYTYYFSPDTLEKNPSEYLAHLNGLIAIRARLREYYPETLPTLRTFLDFLRLQRESGSTITSIQPASNERDDAVTLMTAHKAKGLEFDTVFVIGAIDAAWGEKARSRSRLISYPENLPFQPPGERLDDRLRLFYVAMTRARNELIISYAISDDIGKSQLAASFLTGEQWRPEIIEFNHTEKTALTAAELIWYQPLIRPLTPPMRELLAPKIENYKLNATHLSNFLDLTRGGPETFIINDLLRFPQAPAPVASFGSAIHAALTRAHAHVAATGEQRPHEDILKDFETALKEQYLPPDEFEHFLQRGSLSLGAFLSGNHGNFLPRQKTELNFGGQGVSIGEARLTGILDVVDVGESTASITDYKTGKAIYSWQGKGEYEKLKLHRYRTQLLFYDLLVGGSRDFSRYQVEKCSIQFVEPTRSGYIIILEASFTEEDRERMRKLITAVWRHIMTLDMPDVSVFEPTYKGILDFEQYLIDEP